MSLNFKPVAKSTLADDVARSISEMIQQGTFEPGDRLPTINEMASRFGVGHPTLREALKKLEALGVVSIKHGSGVYVRKHRNSLLLSNPIFTGVLSKKLMMDLIETRVCIEVMSAGLAAEHATEEQLCEMEALLQHASEHLDDDEVLTTTNMAFHREVAVASGNVVLRQVLDVLVELFKREQRIILDIYGNRGRDHTEHRDILEALRAGDAELARQRMQAHLDEVRDVLDRWDPEEHPVQ